MEVLHQEMHTLGKPLSFLSQGAIAPPARMDEENHTLRGIYRSFTTCLPSSSLGCFLVSGNT